MRLFSAFTLCALVASVTALNVTAEEKADKPAEVKMFKTGSLSVPALFKKTKPANFVIEEEFKAGEGEKAARLTMMHASGGVEANIKRWKGQFAGGDPEAQKEETFEVGNYKVHVVDVNGSYAERMGGGPFAGGKVVQRKDYAMVGAIIKSPDGPTYFVKLIGPAETVKANREALVKMIKAAK